MKMHVNLRMSVLLLPIVWILSAGAVCGLPAASGKVAGPAKAGVSNTGSAAGRMHVVFINPGISDAHNPTGTFWLSVSAFMQAAAADLGVELEIVYSERNHLLMQRQAKEVAARPEPPDYVIVVNEKLAADEMVKVLDRAGIKVFVLLNTFSGDQATAMGPPRGKYPSWIGSLIPDNRAAGLAIAERVTEQARRARLFGADGKIHLLAIAGDYVTPASLARNAGLEEALAKYSDVRLEQTFVGEWNQDKARFQVQGALKRYPEVAAIWTANDPMAIGAMEAAREAGKRPGKDIMIGGLNWDVPALGYVRAGELATSVGGHFMAGAWALVLLYDYQHGQDFAAVGTQLQYPIFSALDRDNVSRYLELFGDGDWGKVDFSRFSKVRNPRLANYTFDLATLYRNIEPK